MDKTIQEAIEEVNKSASTNANVTATVAEHKEATEGTDKPTLAKPVENEVVTDPKEKEQPSTESKPEDGVLHTDEEVKKDAVDDDTDLTSSVEDKKADEEVKKDATDDDTDDVEESVKKGAMEDCPDCKDGEPCPKHTEKSAEEVSGKEEAHVDEEKDTVAKSDSTLHDESLNSELQKSIVGALEAMTTLSKSLAEQAKIQSELFASMVEKSATKKDIDENGNGRDDVKLSATEKDKEEEPEKEVSKSVETAEVPESPVEPETPVVDTEVEEVAKSIEPKVEPEEPVSKGVSFDTDDEVAKSIETAEVAPVEKIDKSIDSLVNDIFEVKKSTYSIQRNRNKALENFANEVYYSDEVTKSMLETFEKIKAIKD